MAILSAGEPLVEDAAYSWLKVEKGRKESVEKNSPVPIFPNSDWDFGLDDGVDTSDLVGYLPSALEQ